MRRRPTADYGYAAGIEKSAARTRQRTSCVSRTNRLARYLFLVVILGVFASFTTGSALAACPGLCSAESESTGLANPPAWARGKRIHFEAESEAVSAYQTPNFQLGLEGESLEYHESGSSGVQHSPKVYVIFWGSNFENTAAGRNTRLMLLKLYEGLTGTAYQGILTQYFDSTGRVSSTVATTSYIDKSLAAPKDLKSNEEIENEVSKAIEVNKWTSELSAQFVVVTAPGTTYYEDGAFLEKACAWHGTTGSGAIYDFVPYQGDEPLDRGGEGCVATGNPSKDPVRKTSKSASHEYAEAATDPRVNTYAVMEKVRCVGKGSVEVVAYGDPENGEPYYYIEYATQPFGTFQQIGFARLGGEGSKLFQNRQIINGLPEQKQDLYYRESEGPVHSYNYALPGCS